MKLLKLIFGDYDDDIKKSYEIKETNEFSLDFNVRDINNKMWLLKFDLACIGGSDKAVLYEEDTFGYFRIEYGLMMPKYYSICIIFFY